MRRPDVPREIDLSKIIGDRRLSDAERAVLQFVAAHLAEARTLGVREIARRCFTSPSTVMRLTRKLGYNGFVDMCYRLQAEYTGCPPSVVKPNGAASNLDSRAPDLAPSPAGGAALPDVARVLRHSIGFVHIYGCGFSSLTAAYLSKKLLGLGVRALHSSADDSIAIFENNLDRTDALIVFSRSGRTPRVLDRVKIAGEEGICTVAFTGDRPSPLRDACDFPILVADEQALDDRNTDFTLYFARCIALIEYLMDEYQRLSFS
ncbi:MurR/RpiR family transcriptional regulator [Collinsella sp. OM07-12]|nr:MurR/RpiR family transcriptional regulator [Collinsella sp. OM07-12]RHN20692.1 MurR/RpiR family transcriptional regulator [Collinsella sp. AF31-11]